MAFLQALVIALKVASLEMRDVKVWVSSSVETATALGMILAVFSLVMDVTESSGICICNIIGSIGYNFLLRSDEHTLVT